MWFPQEMGAGVFPQKIKSMVGTNAMVWAWEGGKR
jgi:hypothetical protein